MLSKPFLIHTVYQQLYFLRCFIMTFANILFSYNNIYTYRPIKQSNTLKHALLALNMKPFKIYDVMQLTYYLNKNKYFLYI